MSSKPQKPESCLFEIAAQQQGLFTTAQAINAGFQDATHPYHIRNGDWIREWRGIYRLARYPLSEEGQYVLWSLWSCNRKGMQLGIYSHETALSMFELSDIMPAKLHMTVPNNFRRHSKIPDIIVLHYGKIEKDEIDTRSGYSVTKPIRTVVDLISAQEVSEDIIYQAYKDAIARGFIRKSEIANYLDNPQIGEKIRTFLEKMYEQF